MDAVPNLCTDRGPACPRGDPRHSADIRHGPAERGRRPVACPRHRVAHPCYPVPQAVGD